MRHNTLTQFVEDNKDIFSFDERDAFRSGREDPTKYRKIPAKILKKETELKEAGKEVIRYVVQNRKDLFKDIDPVKSVGSDENERSSGNRYSNLIEQIGNSFPDPEGLIRQLAGSLDNPQSLLQLAGLGEQLGNALTNPGDLLKQVVGTLPDLKNFALDIIAGELLKVIQAPMQIAQDVVEQFYEINSTIAQSVQLGQDISQSIDKVLSASSAKELFEFAKNSDLLSDAIDIVDIIKNQVAKAENTVNYLRQIKDSKDENERTIKQILR